MCGSGQTRHLPQRNVAGGVCWSSSTIPALKHDSQVLLVSKAVPSNPLGGSILIAMVLEDPKSSDRASRSCQQPVLGQGLAGAPL